MKLRILERKQWTVCAIEEQSGGGEDFCSVVDFLFGLSAQYSGSRNGLLKYFEKCAESGTGWLNDDQSHLINTENKIFEFIKGDLRVPWFYGKGGKLIVCSHGFVKDSQKTRKQDLDRAIKVKQAYLEAVEAGNVVFVEEQEG
jgi:hypothetical protein